MYYSSCHYVIIIIFYCRYLISRFAKNLTSKTHYSMRMHPYTPSNIMNIVIYALIPFFVRYAALNRVIRVYHEPPCERNPTTIIINPPFRYDSESLLFLFITRMPAYLLRYDYSVLTP